MSKSKLINILLVEDNPADVRLTEEALKECKLVNRLSVVMDGDKALKYLFRSEGYENAVRPDLILLDLNLPLKSGQEVLEEIKKNDDLRLIPVVVLTASEAEQDIVKSYNLNCNCYVSKPIQFDQFIQVVQAIEEFWFSIVKLPPAKL